MHEITRVNRSNNEARQFYDRISPFYDCIGGFLERRLANRCLEILKINSDETVLEIGFGTGYVLSKVAELVGVGGSVYGIDISPKMMQKTQDRLNRAGLIKQVNLKLGNAIDLPYSEGCFDTVFMSFTLELFDTPEIPKVLGEIKRVLRGGGRIGAVSLSRSLGVSWPIKLYERIHLRWPSYVDCRPIFLVESLRTAGFQIMSCETRRLAVLPVEIAVACKRS
jgi:demethylmenaquinone methyltransferase/2-methoxy-6-polyprenyl-1,4-benzoquinol methylase